MQNFKAVILSAGTKCIQAWLLWVTMEILILPIFHQSPTVHIYYPTYLVENFKAHHLLAGGKYIRPYLLPVTRSSRFYIHLVRQLDQPCLRGLPISHMRGCQLRTWGVCQVTWGVCQLVWGVWKPRGSPSMRGLLQKVGEIWPTLHYSRNAHVTTTCINKN